MTGQNASFLQAFMRRECGKIGPGPLQSRLQVGQRLIGENLLLEMPPQMINRIKFWAGCGKPPQLDLERGSQPAATPSPLPGDLVQEEDDVPAPPLTPDEGEEGVKGRVRIGLREILKVHARLDVQDPGQNALGPMKTDDGHSGLFTEGRPSSPQRGDFIENG